MSIEVLNETDHHADERALVDVARHALDTLGVSPLAELCITLVDVEHMTELHVKWMDEPGPTDVMAFPMDELDLRGSRGAGPAAATRGGRGDGTDGAGPAVLGDVVLCPEIAEKQAVEAGHSRQDELELLTTHGVLHLLGFDHQEPEEHEEMFGLQGELLANWRAKRVT